MRTMKTTGSWVENTRVNDNGRGGTSSTRKTIPSTTGSLLLLPFPESGWPACIPRSPNNRDPLLMPIEKRFLRTQNPSKRRRGTPMRPPHYLPNSSRKHGTRCFKSTVLETVNRAPVRHPRVVWARSVPRLLPQKDKHLASVKPYVEALRSSSVNTQVTRSPKRIGTKKE